MGDISIRETGIAVALDGGQQLVIVDDMMLGGDVAQDGLASKHHDGHDLQVGPGTQRPPYGVGVGHGLLHRIIETVLCDIGIGLVPFLHVCDIGDDDLRPLLAVVVAVDVATIVFGLNGEDTVSRHNHMINLCGAVACLQHHIIKDGVVFGKLRKDVLDMQLSFFAFMLWGAAYRTEDN